MNDVREPACPGRFYPAETRKLREQVRGYVDGADVELDIEACGIIAPHAGYPFSGPVAGHSYGAIADRAEDWERIVLVGPSHFVEVSGLAVPTHEAFRTPLGEVEVDREVVDALLEEGLVEEHDGAHRREHSLETHLPFLQVVFDEVPPIVPVVTGREASDAVAAMLERTWDDGTLLSVSSDLSHYLDYETARRVDDETREAIEARRADEIGRKQACGYVAIRGLVSEAQRRELGVETLAMANSGDTAGDRSEVVGYGAWVVGPAGSEA